MAMIGILGGMGPMATADLFEKMINNTPAEIDQDHLKILIYNNPQIPSRVEAILNDGQSPKAELIASAKVLEKAGADFIAMPCNTAHYWYKDIQAATRINIIHMIENAAQYVRDNGIDKSGKIMLFSTIATERTGLYQEAFARCGIEIDSPKPDEQEVMAEAIDAIKAGRYEDNPILPLIDRIIARYQKAGYGAFIAGCTEIPLLFRYTKGDYYIIDPTEILAQTAVKMALALQNTK